MRDRYIRGHHTDCQNYDSINFEENSQKFHDWFMLWCFKLMNTWLRLIQVLAISLNEFHLKMSRVNLQENISGKILYITQKECARILFFQGARRWISPFSILRNLPQLFATTSSPDDYKMLHGIKAVLMLFVVIAHISSIRMLGRAAIVNWDYVEDVSMP